MKKYIAECIGTFVLTAFGCGSAVAANTLLGNSGQGLPLAYSTLLIAFAFGLTIVAMKGRSTVTDAFTAVNQESVYSRIRSYNGNGKFGVQKKADTRYYVHRLQEAGAKGAKIYLLEYTKSSALKAKIRKQCVKNGWQYYIADSIGLE